MTALVVAAALVVAPPSGAWVTISQAELEASYDQLWAVSDVHGHRVELERLLRSAGLASGADDELHWEPRARRQLLFFTGDLIRGGPDSRGVLRLVERLVAEAPAAASRVVVLLGNEEVRTLVAGPKHAKRFLHEAAAAAFVGPWLFAHSGFIAAAPGEEPLKAWLDEVARLWARGGRERYAQFLSGRSIVDCHEWWKSRRNRKAMRKKLDLLGLDAVVFGHDPWALGAPGTIAIDADAFLLKLDTGLKENRSAGMLLRCSVPEALRRGLSTCRAALPDGSLAAVTAAAAFH